MAGMEKRGFHFGGGVTSGVVECLDKRDIIATHTYEYNIYIYMCVYIYIYVCVLVCQINYMIYFFDIT